jgi:hypothetical protein
MIIPAHARPALAPPAAAPYVAPGPTLYRSSPPHVAPASALPYASSRSEAGKIWWDDPITIGLMLTFIPPAGLAALWASRHFTESGRWVISAIMSLALFTVAIAVILVLR